MISVCMTLLYNKKPRRSGAWWTRGESNPGLEPTLPQLLHAYPVLSFALAAAPTSSYKRLGMKPLVESTLAVFPAVRLTYRHAE
jgi:hypothetical protein